MASTVTITGVKDIETAIARMRSRIENCGPLLESLGGMAVEHVHDRFRGQGRSRRYDGRGGQPPWAPLRESTKRIRNIRTGESDSIIWRETGEAVDSITLVSSSRRHVEIGWNPGQFKGKGGSHIPYPFLLDSYTVHTQGICPGGVTEPRPLVYFTGGFAAHAVKEAARWVVSPLGLRVA